MPADSIAAVQGPDSGECSAFALRRARSARVSWAERSVAERLRVVRDFRHRLADRGAELAARVGRVDPVETLTAEVLPLAEACRFLESEARGLLAPRRPRRRSPIWLRGTRVTIHRRPLGVVLVIAPSNYPLFLPAVQVLQALVAGNAVALKPAPGTMAVARLVRDLLIAAGLDPDLLVLLDEAVESVDRALAAGVDHVVLTGSASTGRALLRKLADPLVPATLELSGCDAVFVLPGADLDRAADALAYGLRLNGGATCIAPRRVFVPTALADELASRLVDRLTDAPRFDVPPAAAAVRDRGVRDALDRGARRLVGDPDDAGSPTVLVGATVDMELFTADCFAPILTLVPVGAEPFADAALHLDRRCPYALGAAVFGPAEAARRLAERVDAGVVTVGDLVVPTADPRVPFGGHGESGWGRTRGAEGLLAMSRTHTVVERRGRFLPHLDPERPGVEFFGHYLRAAHGAPGGRWRAAIDLARAALRDRRAHPETPRTIPDSEAS